MGTMNGIDQELLAPDEKQNDTLYQFSQVVKDGKRDDVKEFLEDHEDDIKPDAEYIMLYLAVVHGKKSAYEDVYSYFDLQDLSVDEGEEAIPATYEAARKDPDNRQALLTRTIDACVSLKEKLCLFQIIEKDAASVVFTQAMLYDVIKFDMACAL